MGFHALYVSVGSGHDHRFVAGAKESSGRTPRNRRRAFSYWYLWMSSDRCFYHCPFSLLLPHAQDTRVSTGANEEMTSNAPSPGDPAPGGDAPDDVARAVAGIVLFMARFWEPPTWWVPDIVCVSLLMTTLARSRAHARRTSRQRTASPAVTPRATVEQLLPGMMAAPIAAKFSRCQRGEGRHRRRRGLLLPRHLQSPDWAWYF